MPNYFFFATSYEGWNLFMTALQTIFGFLGLVGIWLALNDYIKSNKEHATTIEKFDLLIDQQRRILIESRKPEFAIGTNVPVYSDRHVFTLQNVGNSPGKITNTINREEIEVIVENKNNFISKNHTCTVQVRNENNATLRPQQFIFTINIEDQDENLFSQEIYFSGSFHITPAILLNK